MKILAWAASNSHHSINKALASYAARLYKQKFNPDADVEILDINDYEMAIYSIDRESANGIPELAHRFYQKIGEADMLIVSFAEHNGSLTAAYKNLFDWASRIDGKVYQDKPALYLSTSPGPGGGASVLASSVTSAQFFGAQVKAELSVPEFHKNFDLDEGVISNPELVSRLESALGNLM